MYWYDHMVGQHAPTGPKRSASANWHIGAAEYGTTIPQYTEKTRQNNAASTHSHDTHTSSAVPCHRVQAPQRPVAVLLLLLLLLLLQLRLRTLWQQKKPSTSCWHQMTTTKAPRNVSTQSQASQSKGPGQHEGEGATSSRSN